MSYPSISVVFASLNASSVIESCLASIRSQDYPKEKIEIIVADGGSTDGTVKIAKKYGARVLNNPLKTSESGKAVGVKVAKGDLITFIDSDNIVPNKDWFKQMVKPFDDPEIILSEPIEYTYRKSDPILTRYFALLGMNDPICLFLGNYDRYSTITGRWTDLTFSTQDKKTYLKVKLDKLPLPTIGANGTVIRKKTLLSHWHGDYLFDIDIIVKIVTDSGPVYVAKVKNGIVHTFVEQNPFKFFRKQLRRVNDLMYHQARGSRQVNWQGSFLAGIIKFQIECLLIVPIIWQTIVGFKRKPDIAWLFHPVAVYSTWIIYLYGYLRGKIVPKESNRVGWKQ